MRRLLALVLCLGLAASFLAADCSLTVLHFNDFHGYLLPSGKPPDDVGGLARIAAFADSVRAWNETQGKPTLFYEAGDILQGTPLSAVYMGEPDFQCLNLMGLDAMCLGNHEFDFGRPNLDKLMKLADFPMLAANIYFKDTGKRFTRGYYTFTLPDGTPAVVMGLTTPETAVATLPKYVADLNFTDPAAECRRVMAEVPRARFLVALTHLGHEEDLALAKAVPQLDLIVGGHSHTVVRHPVRVGQTVVCQAGSYGQYLGRLELTVSGGDVSRCSGYLRRMDSRLQPDPAVQKIIDQYNSTLQEKLKEVIAQTTVRLDGDREKVRSSETNLGNLLADLLREYTRADVAVINGGGLRASIEAGDITQGDMLNVLPFSNLIATKAITGDQLRRALAFSASLPRPAGGFLQVSGASLVIAGNTLQEVKVGGQPLDPAKTYTLATGEFLLSGGDGYSMLAEGPAPNYLGFTDNAIAIDLLRAKGTVSPQVEGRIVIK